MVLLRYLAGFGLAACSFLFGELAYLGAEIYREPVQAIQPQNHLNHIGKISGVDLEGICANGASSLIFALFTGSFIPKKLLFS